MAYPVAELDTVSVRFGARLRVELAALIASRATLRIGLASSLTLEELQSRAHKLAGASGVFGFRDVSALATALEESVAGRRVGDDRGSVEDCLDALIGCIENLPPA